MVGNSQNPHLLAAFDFDTSDCWRSWCPGM